MSGDPLTTYLDLLFGAEPAGAFLEVRRRLAADLLGREEA